MYLPQHSQIMTRRQWHTIDPWDGHTLGQGDEHEGEAGAVPVHDLQHVDATLADAGQTQQELHHTRHRRH